MDAALPYNLLQSLIKDLNWIFFTPPLHWMHNHL